MELYKFRPINKYFIDSLVKGYLFCAPPGKLNDPFDCKVDIVRSIHAALDKLEGAPKDNLLKLLGNDVITTRLPKQINKVGIHSFSSDLTERPIKVNPLMWSHYADNHRGVCVLYDIPKTFISTENRIMGSSQVYYEANRITEWFIETAHELPKPESDVVIEIAIKIFTSKNPNWFYENEYRIVSLEHGKITIPKAFIKEICFGLHTSEDDISLIREIIADFDDEIGLLQAVRDGSDFGIKITGI